MTSLCCGAIPLEHSCAASLGCLLTSQVFRISGLPVPRPSLTQRRARGNKRSTVIQQHLIAGSSAARHLILRLWSYSVLPRESPLPLALPR